MGNTSWDCIRQSHDVLPWKDTRIESERLQFIERHTAGEETVAELCRRSGISRKTGYNIIGRYEAYDENGLVDLSRAPHSHPNATPIEVAERIIEAKRTHPTWGPKKIVAWLHSIDPYLTLPSSSTAGAILDRAGLVRRRKRDVGLHAGASPSPTPGTPMTCGPST